MGLITVPAALALPSFAMGCAVSILRRLWQRRPSGPAAAVTRLRNWGRKD